MLADVETLKTRLTQRIDEFSKWLTGAILILAAGTMVFGLALRDYSFTELFFAGVALAVAAIPEGLPAIITITLALGVQRMARQKAIIRRLPAVETLGSVTVICSDKTGTLTRNEMTVTTILRADKAYQVDGAGYQPQGSFHVDGSTLEPGKDRSLIELIRAGLLCNDGSISQKEGIWSVQGDPTDGALVTLALKAGLNSQQCNEELPRKDIIPFESDHKFMATLHHDSHGKSIVYLKGAPERVLEMCSQERHAGGDKPIEISYWREQIEAIARLGQRTLAVAALDAGDKETISIRRVEERHDPAWPFWHY